MISVGVICPVRDRAWILPEWLAGLDAQRADVDLEVVVYDDGSADGSGDLARDAGCAVISDPSLVSPVAPEEMAGHAWRPNHYAHMAEIRNRLAAAVEGRSDRVLSIDSDVLLAPGTLGRLLDGLGPSDVVAPLVNVSPLRGWVAWNYMDWFAPDWARRPADASGWLPFDGRYRVGVVFACYLIPGRAPLPRWRSHVQGEDVGWALSARAAGLRVRVDTREIARHALRRRVPEHR